MMQSSMPVQCELLGHTVPCTFYRGSTFMIQVPQLRTMS